MVTTHTGRQRLDHTGAFGHTEIIRCVFFPLMRKIPSFSYVRSNIILFNSLIDHTGSCNDGEIEGILFYYFIFKHI